jgi:hypothetical protein
MITYTLSKPLPPRAVKLQPIADRHHAADAACPDGGWKALTREEKKRLCMLAASAAKARGLDLRGKTLDAWRAAESIKACGLRISEATHAHWADIKAHFECLGGQYEKAFETQLRDGDNKRRVAMHKLQNELAAKRLPPAYAESICRTQYKVGLAEASAKQLWCLFYTVKNRKNK